MKLSLRQLLADLNDPVRWLAHLLRREQIGPEPSPSQAQQSASPGVYALLAGVDRR